VPKPKPDTFLPLKSNWFHILVCLVGASSMATASCKDVLERSGGNVARGPHGLYLD